MLHATSWRAGVLMATYWGWCGWLAGKNMPCHRVKGEFSFYIASRSVNTSGLDFGLCFLLHFGLMTVFVALNFIPTVTFTLTKFTNFQNVTHLNIHVSTPRGEGFTMRASHSVFSHEYPFTVFNHVYRSGLARPCDGWKKTTDEQFKARCYFGWGETANDFPRFGLAIIVKSNFGMNPFTSGTFNKFLGQPSGSRPFPSQPPTPTMRFSLKRPSQIWIIHPG